MLENLPGTKLPGGADNQEKQDNVRRLFTPEQIQAWDKIKDDKHLRGILAEFETGSLNNRDRLVLADVKDFLRDFPDREKFKQKVKESMFLEMIGVNNGHAKRALYESKLKEFEEIMYGKKE